MKLEERMNHLFQRLRWLGYYPFQIQRMVHEAVGSVNLKETNRAQRAKIINNLEKYEQLGRHYLQSYSK